MNDETYKYYLFYLKDEYYPKIPLVLDDTMLYAYTDDEKTASLFINLHDMKKFKVIKKYISREEVNYYANYYMKYRLEIKSIYTRKDDTQIQEMKLAVSMEEHETVQININYEMFNRIFQYCNPASFNDTIFYALCKLGYYSMNCNANSDSVRNKMYSVAKIEADYLYFYIQNFKILITKGDTI